MGSSAGNVPLATGLGWALKYNKTDNICVCYFGDGSMNAGGFHEALNMAALYRLPILYVLENNGYAMGTSIDRSHANTDLGSRAESYNIPHAKVDGQDYFAVRSLAQEVIDTMRKDPYPFFIDAITYRFVGHGAADQAETQKTYREPSEVERWRQRDPVLVLKQKLMARGHPDRGAVPADGRAGQGIRARGGEVRGRKPGVLAAGALGRRLRGLGIERVVPL